MPGPADLARRLGAWLVVAVPLACGDAGPEGGQGSRAPRVPPAREATTGPETHGSALAESLPPDTAEDTGDIEPAAANRSPPLPLGPESRGPAILHVQVLLDRALFSPGVIDGHWGMNTEKALVWFQRDNGLADTGVVDSATYAALAAVAGPAPVVQVYQVTEEDLAGPFEEIPDDVYDQAELSCLCYTSPVEALAERFHTTPKLLARLNPGVDLDTLRAGMPIQVPAVREELDGEPAKGVARIVISKDGFYTHALDETGSILYHFPSTLGSAYDPSPAGHLRVAAIEHDPHFHYQPELFSEVPDDEPEAMLPPGPNSPVGVVWMALSEPHYGIHGTAEPQTIGYTASHGCVRLTNWDARFLARRIELGTPVEFR